MQLFENLFCEKMNSILGTRDPAHDIAHVKRVVKTAKFLSFKEKAKLEIVLPAAWLHDFVNLPKNHPRRAEASKASAIEALLFLESINYPSHYFSEIYHAIEAHSFSAGIKVETLEAKIVQDADRLDGLGAIGLARLFSVSSQLNRPFYISEDPFAKERSLDDKICALDHIEIKLRKISQQMNTSSAHQEAQKRFNFIEVFLQQLKSEIVS